jgi:hypothetical protein
MDWRLVFHSVVTASILGLATATIDQGRDLSAIAARQEIVLQRLAALESGTNSATSERYRASDATRDIARIEARIQRIEESQRAHESEDRLRFKSMGK